LLAKEIDDRFHSFIPLGSNGKKKNKNPEETKTREVVHTEKGSGKT
jgi:hypothetical protein